MPNEVTLQVEDDDLLRAVARRRDRNRTMLVVATIVVFLSFALRVRDDTRVEFRLCPGYPLPESCMSKAWFHHDCPGCGLTRSFIFLAQGDWRRSFSTHRIGWLLALSIVAQFPYRWISLRQPEQIRSPDWARWFGWLLIVLLFGNWLMNAVLAGNSRLSTDFIRECPRRLLWKEEIES